MDRISNLIKTHSQKNLHKRIHFPYAQRALIASDVFKKYKSRYENIIEKNHIDCSKMIHVIRSKCVLGTFSSLKRKRKIKDLMEDLYTNSIYDISRHFTSQTPWSFTTGPVPEKITGQIQSDPDNFEISNFDYPFENLNPEPCVALLDGEENKLDSLGNINLPTFVAPALNSSTSSDNDLQVLTRDVWGDPDYFEAPEIVDSFQTEKECFDNANDIVTNVLSAAAYENKLDEKTKKGVYNHLEKPLQNVLSCEPDNSKTICNGPYDKGVTLGNPSQDNLSSTRNALKSPPPNIAASKNIESLKKRSELMDSRFNTLCIFEVNIVQLAFANTSNNFLFSLLYSLDVLFLNWITSLGTTDKVEQEVALFRHYLHTHIQRHVVKSKQKKYVESLSGDFDNELILELVTDIFSINLLYITTSSGNCDSLSSENFRLFPQKRSFSESKKTIFVIDNRPTYLTQTNVLPKSFWRQLFTMLFDPKVKLADARDLLSILGLNCSIDVKNKKSLLQQVVIPFINDKFKE